VNTDEHAYRSNTSDDAVVEYGGAAIDPSIKAARARDALSRVSAKLFGDDSGPPLGEPERGHRIDWDLWGKAAFRPMSNSASTTSSTPNRSVHFRA
jgi:hypothetical protein